jgi:PAS domain S-box-containing protein
MRRDRNSRRRSDAGSEKPASAIREESDLRTKIQRLEKQAAEFKSSLEKESAEKSRLESRLDSAAAGLAVLDEKGAFTYVNIRLCEMLGSSAKTLLKSRFLDLVPEHARSEVASKLGARGGRMPSALEVPVSVGGGKDRRLVMLLSVRPLYDSKGRFEGNFTAFTDITARIEAEEKLRRLTEFHGMILENSPVGIFTLDESGVVTSENQFQVNFLGGGRSAVGKRLAEIPAAKETGFAEHVKSALKGNTVAVRNFPYKSIFTGKTAFVSIHLVPLPGPTGKAAGVLGILEDTTEKTKRERELEVANNIIENTKDAVISGDFAGNMFSWNPAAEEMYGFTREEIFKGGNLQIPPERIEELKYFESVLRKGEKIINFFTRRMHKSGRLLDVCLTISPLKDDSGKLTGMAAIHRDVTESKRSERELKAAYEKLESTLRALRVQEEEVRKSEEKYRLSFEYIPILLTAIDATGKFILWNPYAEKMLGYSAKEAIGKITPAQLHESAEVGRGVLETAAKNGIFDGEVNLVRKDGSFVVARLIVVTQKNSAGEIIRYYGFAEDITARKRAETERMELDRLRDDIISTVSYEFRTPLVAVAGYIDLMLDGKLGDVGDDCKTGLSVAKRNLLRLDKITEDLLVFSQIDSVSADREGDFFPLEDVVSLAVADLKVRTEKEHLLINSTVPGDLPLVLANEKLIGQVFSNLLSNAEKFSGPDVTIAIKAAVKNEDRIEVAIADNGVGIPRGEREKIFQKFYKIDGAGGRGGIGIGLALVKKILELYNCSIRVEDNPGGGARVVFELPRAKMKDEM